MLSVAILELNGVDGALLVLLARFDVPSRSAQACRGNNLGLAGTASALRLLCESFSSKARSVRRASKVGYVGAVLHIASRQRLLYRETRYSFQYSFLF